MTQAKQKADELRVLAERCEQASEADLALDTKIAVASAYATCRPTNAARYEDGTWVENQFGHVFRPPAYTASLDAALTLVPEKHWFVLNVSHDGKANAQTHAAGSAYVQGTNGPTPPLALCAAALRARAAILETEQ